MEAMAFAVHVLIHQEVEIWIGFGGVIAIEYKIHPTSCLAQVDTLASITPLIDVLTSPLLMLTRAGKDMMTSLYPGGSCSQHWSRCVVEDTLVSCWLKNQKMQLDTTLLANESW